MPNVSSEEELVEMSPAPAMWGLGKRHKLSHSWSGADPRPKMGFGAFSGERTQ